VDSGSKLVEAAGRKMGEVVDSIGRLTAVMGDVAQASREQTSGIEQVDLAMSQMDGVTQQNSALVEEAGAAAQSMRKQAQDLVAAVSIFKLGADEADAGAQTAAGVQAQRAAAQHWRTDAPASPVASDVRQPAIAA